MPQVVLRGRSAQVETAISVLRRAGRDGLGGVLLFTGEAGIGKSTVLDALGAEALSSGFVRGMGKAEAIGQISPGAPFLLALRSGPSPLLDHAMFVELTTLISQPVLLVDRVSQVLEALARRSPVLIAIDDVQWADQLSVFALRVLTSRLAASPVVWAFTSRDTAEGLVANLSVPGVQGVTVQVVHLGPLASEDVAAIAQDRLGRVPSEPVRSMLRGVAGNPFLVTQILDGLVRSQSHGDHTDQLPTEFIVGVRRTLNSLAPPEAELVQLAAVLGRPFTHAEALELMAGSTASGGSSVAGWIQRCVNSGLLTRTGVAVGFRHDLVRETVYNELTDRARRELHRRCAAYLMTTGHRALDAAPHARASASTGDENAAAILSAAAEEAVSAMPDTAADLFFEAFSLLRPTQPLWQSVGERCVETLCRVQRGADALAVADTLLARGFADPDRAARVEVLAVGAAWQSGLLGEALRRVEAALAHPDISPAVQARLQAARALALTRIRPENVARVAVQAALTQAAGVHDEDASTVATRAAAEVAKHSARHTEALDYFQRLRHDSGETYLAEEILALQQLDRYAEAEILLVDAHRDAHGDVEATLPSVTHAQLWQDFNLGRLDKADAGAAALIEISRRTGNQLHRIEAQTVRVSIALLRGWPEQARTLLGPVVTRQAVEHDDDAVVLCLHLVQGWLAADEGRPQMAADIFAPALYAAWESGNYWPWLPGRVRMLTLTAIAVDDQQLLKQVLAIADEGAARNPGVASMEGTALQARGLALRSPELLAQASEVLALSPRPLMQAQGAEDHGRALVKSGSRVEGVRVLDRSWDIYQRLGVRKGMLAVQHTMRDAGSRRSKWVAEDARSTTGWDSLTQHERRVARLIAAGHTNRSAAERLGVSVNTVGTHMRSIFAKLGIQSRVQLSNVLGDRK